VFVLPKVGLFPTKKKPPPSKGGDIGYGSGKKKTDLLSKKLEPFIYGERLDGKRPRTDRQRAEEGGSDRQHKTVTHEAVPSEKKRRAYGKVRRHARKTQDAGRPLGQGREEKGSKAMTREKGYTGTGQGGLKCAQGGKMGWQTLVRGRRIENRVALAIEALGIKEIAR